MNSVNRKHSSGLFVARYGRGLRRYAGTRTHQRFALLTWRSAREISTVSTRIALLHTLGLEVSMRTREGLAVNDPPMDACDRVCRADCAVGVRGNAHQLLGHCGWGSSGVEVRYREEWEERERGREEVDRGYGLGMPRGAVLRGIGSEAWRTRSMTALEGKAVEGREQIGGMVREVRGLERTLIPRSHASMHKPGLCRGCLRHVMRMKCRACCTVCDVRVV